MPTGCASSKPRALPKLLSKQNYQIVERKESMMNIPVIIVNALGLALIGLVVWYFWLYRREGVQIAEIAGVQEATIKVKGGYEPDVIVVKKGKPVRLHFLRQESSMCSEMVIFDKIQKSAKLPEGETVTIEFTPQENGEIPFQCQMGMLRGKVIVAG